MRTLRYGVRICIHTVFVFTFPSCFDILISLFVRFFLLFIYSTVCLIHDIFTLLAKYVTVYLDSWEGRSVWLLDGTHVWRVYVSFSQYNRIKCVDVCAKPFLQSLFQLDTDIGHSSSNTVHMRLREKYGLLYKYLHWRANKAFIMLARAYRQRSIVCT